MAKRLREPALQMYARLCLRDAVSLPAFEEPDGVAHGDGERPALPQKGDQRLQRRVQVAMQLLRDHQYMTSANIVFPFPSSLFKNAP